MLELLGMFSLTEVITFLVLLAGAMRGFISFWDWGIARARQAFKKESQREEQIKRIEDLETWKSGADDTLKELLAAVQLLTQSDRDDIKAWITEKHHYFCYDQTWIDDYSLDCIEKRFKHYEEEGGNSFVKDLMNDLRALPKRSIILMNKNEDEKGEHR